MTYDYILVGGGLQSSLIALAVLHERPGSRLALVEQGASLGGNHIWCFHAGDVPADAGGLAAGVVDALVAHRWDGYEVRFRALERSLDSAYAAITCERLDRVVRERLAAAPGCELMLDTRAACIEADRVVLADGRELCGRLVVDARGPDWAAVNTRATGYQKFVGVEVVLQRAHGLTRPILMDATVPQVDGFRFFYTLPLAADRLLVEDTCFSSTAVLESERLEAEALAYAAAQGWEVAQVLRRESGVLPLPWQGSCEPGTTGPLVAGYQGGWFHPVTGYSFPMALKLALHIARTHPDAVFGPGLHELARAQRQQLSYAHQLNRLLYNWFAPEDRHYVLERFYRMPEDLIRRFYALELTAKDRARILLGRPPRGISLRVALAAWSAR